METDQWTDWIDGFIRYTEDIESPYLWKVWTAYSVVASVLQRKCSFQAGHGLYYPNLYVVLVGPSGIGKGIIMGPGRDMLQEVSGVQLAAEAITREALIRQLKSTSYTHIDPETEKVYLHSSLTVYSPELTVFLGYNNQTLMSDLTDWYDCRDPWTYRTKNMGTDVIRGIWVNLIGATTPDLLVSTLPREMVGGGLASRIIFVYESKRSKIISPFDQRIDPALYDKLVNQLEMMCQLRGEYTFTPEYKAAWNEWYYNQEKNLPFRDARLSGYMTRRKVHITKISMISAASRSCSLSLELIDWERALKTLEATEVKMQKTFSGFGKYDNADVLARVATTIGVEKTILFSELMARHYYDSDRDTLMSIVKALRTMKYCTAIQQENDVVITYLENEEIGI